MSFSSLRESFQSIVDSYEKELEIATKRCEELQKALSNAEEDLTTCRELKGRRDAEIGELQAELASSKGIINDLQAMINHRDEEKKKREEIIERQLERIKELEASFAATEAAGVAATKERNTYRQQVANLQGRIEALEHSEEVRRMLSKQLAEFNETKDQLDQVRKENRELASWKLSAMNHMMSAQEVGPLLGWTAGMDLRTFLVPSIKGLLEKQRILKEAMVSRLNELQASGDRTTGNWMETALRDFDAVPMPKSAMERFPETYGEEHHREWSEKPGKGTHFPHADLPVRWTLNPDYENASHQLNASGQMEAILRTPLEWAERLGYLVKNWNGWRNHDHLATPTTREDFESRIAHCTLKPESFGGYIDSLFDPASKLTVSTLGDNIHLTTP